MPFKNHFQKSAMDEKKSPQQQDPSQEQDIVDKGRKAWTFLAAAAATNIITYGKHLVASLAECIVLSSDTRG